MGIKDGNYEAEDIEGFHVTSMMKRFWAACLENLFEVDRICKKHDIKYFLVFGSLLGAVRHKGFIPWDDDLDIAMLRKDYDRFMEIADTELSEPFFIMHKGEDSCFYTTSVHNTYTPQIESGFLERFHGCPYSSVLDIFPIDNIPDDEKELEEFRDTYGLVKYLSQISDPEWNSEFISTHMVDRTVISDEDKELALNHIEKMFGEKIDRGPQMHRQLAMMANKFGAKYKDVECKRVGYIKNMNLKTLSYGCIPAECYNDLIDTDFEGYQIPIPRDYERVLPILFGSGWRTPRNYGGSHNYPVYRKHAEILKAVFDRYGAQPPEYFYL